MDATDGVLPVGLGEALVLVRAEGGLEERTNGREFGTGELGRRQATHAEAVGFDDGRGTSCTACDDPRMVEYGNGVSGVAGQVAGGSGNGAGRSVDVGASASQFITDTAHTLSTMPPAALLGLVVVIFLGLVFLRRAF
jgi:hypothetical protein